MSKQREAFEAWANQHLTMDGYPQYTAWNAWQASRAAALEEAAAHIEDAVDLYDPSEFAAEIRALKEQS